MPRTIVQALFTASCLSIAAQGVGAKPDEASFAQVQNCRLVENVSGSSGYGKNSGWQAIAKTRAERKAGELGATHIVWTGSRSIGSFNGEVSANAYYCQR
jgi:hypothetical protein